MGLIPDDVLVSSTLQRSIASARALGREPLRCHDLDEFRFGPAWTWAQSDAREDTTLWRPEHRAGGESLAEFEARVCRSFEGHVGRVPPGAGRLVVVVHSGVIDVLLRWAFGATGTPWIAEACVAPASITELGIAMAPAPGRPRLTEVRRLGDTSHLPEALRAGL